MSAGAEQRDGQADVRGVRPRRRPGHPGPGHDDIDWPTDAAIGDTRTAGATGVNFALSMTAPLLDRLASRVATGSIGPPPITRLSLDDVPAFLGKPSHAEGETVITIGARRPALCRVGATASSSLRAPDWG